MLTKLTIIIVMNHFVLVVNFRNCFVNELTEKLLVTQGLIQFRFTNVVSIFQKLFNSIY